MVTLFGWTPVLVTPPEPRGLILVYPHTSNWDFILGVLFRVGCGDPNCDHCKTIEGEPIPTVDEVDQMADAAGLRNCQGPDCPTCAMNAQSAAYQQALNANLLYVDEPAPAPPADAIGYLTRYYNDTLVPEARDAGVVNIEPLDGGG